MFNSKELGRIDDTLRVIERKGLAEKGCHLVSGAITITGHFYGLSIGSTKPDTLKIITSDKIYINGVKLASTDDIVNFLSEGEFFPVEFTSITLTGSGYVKCYTE